MFYDNTKQSKKGALSYNKLYKIRHLLDILKENFGKLPQEEHQSAGDKIICVKWFDKKAVELLSSREDHQPVGICYRCSS